MHKSLAVIIFWSSFQSLTLEVLLTRIYSATIGFNYAYLIVSIALGGIGIGALLTLSGRTKASYPTIIAITAASVPLLLGFVAYVPGTPSTIWAYFSVSCIPFVLTGLILSKALGGGGPEAHTIYFADLVAASFAPPVSVILMYLVNPQTILLFSSMAGAALAMLLTYRNKPGEFAPNRRMFVVVVACLIICSSFVGFNSFSRALTNYPTPLKPSLNSAMQTGMDDTTIWNPISRVDLVGSGGGGLVGAIIIDGDAYTPIFAWNKTGPELPVTHYMLHVPYALNTRKNVLIIGSGGGPDVVEALMSGAQNVTAVEINPAIVNIVKGFGASAGNIYTNQKVSVYIDEGRSFLARSTSKFDLISLTLVDSWAAVSTGAYATSEAYLYTTDSFRLMLDHLSPNGTLVIVRWYSEIPKDLLTLSAALEQDGVPASQVGSHIAVLAQVRQEISTSPGSEMIIVKKTSFTSSELSVLQNVSPYEHIYVPGFNSSTVYGKFFAEGANQTYLTLSFPNSRIVAPTDNTPYYFDFTPGVPFQLAQALAVNVAIAGAIAIIAFASKSTRRSITSTSLSWIGYYGLIGFGFILIEIALLQRLTLLIGYPTIAFASLLFFLLVSSAFGSILSARIRNSSMPTVLAGVCALIALGALALAAFLPWAVGSTISLNLVDRVGVSGVLMAPIGVLMGMPFPSGLRRISVSQGSGSIPILLGINFVASVIAAIVAVIIGIYAGLIFSLIAATVCYLLAAMVWFSLRRRKQV